MQKTTDNENTSLHKINVLLGKACLMQEVLTDLYKDADTLEHTLYEKLKLCEPYIYDQRIIPCSNTKYPSGSFRGNFPEIPFLESPLLSKEEAELLLAVYNACYLNLEQYIFGLEHMIKEFDFIADYYAAVYLTKGLRRGEKHPDKLNCCFIPGLAFGGLLEKKTEQFLEKALEFFFFGSSALSSDALGKGPGEFFLEDYLMLLKKYSSLKKKLNSVFHTRMLPRECPVMVRKGYELFCEPEQNLLERVSDAEV